MSVDIFVFVENMGLQVCAHKDIHGHLYINICIYIDKYIMYDYIMCIIYDL